MRNLAVYFSAYLEKAYWVEMFNIIKTIYDRDMRIVRATRYSAVDFVLFILEHFLRFMLQFDRFRKHNIKSKCFFCLDLLAEIA